MTPIFLISVRTASTHPGIYPARNFHNKTAKSQNKGTCPKSQTKEHPQPSSAVCPARATNLPSLFPQGQCSPANKQQKFTVHSVPPSPKGGHMHKHILCAHSSPQALCSPSTPSSVALQEHYQGCNKAQQLLIEPSPLVETPAPGLSPWHRELCAPPDMELS